MTRFNCKLNNHILFGFETTEVFAQEKSSTHTVAHLKSTCITVQLMNYYWNFGQSEMHCAKSFVQCAQKPCSNELKMYWSKVDIQWLTKVHIDAFNEKKHIICFGCNWLSQAAETENRHNYVSKKELKWV